ncbi:50S ribosomal protein L24 [Candidatus Bathyarchaeota archaeon]|nr:MAG: 50S ribosomal protein L24 [Candidatus Hecatellales archaeon]RLI34287.1 MAG: 50S ribosomal protein L24 [Candidatus Bathyarchaeota archaeon]
MARLSSVKPSRQRKAMYQAPQHVRRKMVSAHLSPELRARYFVRSLPLRKGDTVRIMRGAYAGIEGKVRSVDLKRFRVTVEGVTREKADGTTVFIPIHPSNLMITKLDLSDKWRASRLKALTETVLEAERKEMAEEEAEKEVEKEVGEKTGEAGEGEGGKPSGG